MAEADDTPPLLTDDIRELLRLVSEGDIAEVKIERGGAKVHIKRAVAQPPIVSVVPGVSQQAAVPVTPFATPMPAPPSEPGTQDESKPDRGFVVTAPMVGTFYSAAAPKEPPYVQVGDEVRPGDVLGIIEAMKIMNEIECEVQGTVREILVENGQPVEYGQALMIIEQT